MIHSIEICIILVVHYLSFETAMATSLFCIHAVFYTLHGVAEWRLDQEIWTQYKTSTWPRWCTAWLWHHVVRSTGFGFGRRKAGDFKYTGENSSRIKDAIYNSGLEVSFTGASVSVNTCTLLLLHNTFIWTIAYHATIHMSDKNSFLHAYYRASWSSSPMETELQSYDISSIGLTVKVKAITFFYWYHNRPSS